MYYIVIRTPYGDELYQSEHLNVLQEFMRKLVIETVDDTKTNTTPIKDFIFGQDDRIEDEKTTYAMDDYSAWIAGMPCTECIIFTKIKDLDHQKKG